MLIMVIYGHLLERNVDEDTCMAVVPYRLHVEKESNQEAHQYGEELYGEAKLTHVSKHR